MTSWITNLETICVDGTEGYAALGAAVACTLGICVDLAQQLVRQTTYNTTEINLCDDFETCEAALTLLSTSGPC